MRFRRLRGDDLDEDDNNYVEKAIQRLHAANLAPPVNGLQLIECVEVTTTSDVTPELSELVARALGDIPHIVRQVPPGHGVLYSTPS